MIPAEYLGLIEMGLVLALAVGWGWYELRGLKKLRQERDKD